MLTSPNNEQPWQQKIRALRKARSMNQAEFAEALHVTQQTVSAWENGQYDPSAETFTRLGNLAEYPDCLWFYEQAGVNLSNIAPALERQLIQRKAAATGDQRVRLPLWRGLPSGASHDAVIAMLRSPSLAKPEMIESWITLPSEFVPHPESTSAFRADDEYMRAIFGAGNIVLVDASHSAIAPVGGSSGLRDIVQPSGDIVAARKITASGPKTNAPEIHGSKVYFRWIKPEDDSKTVLLSSEAGKTVKGLRALLGDNAWRIVDQSRASEFSDIDITGDPNWAILGVVVCWIGARQRRSVSDLVRRTRGAK
jgi:DNA-binding XRE family transcriptional regulator